MKKSIFILLFILTTIFVASLVYADSQNVNVNVNVTNVNNSGYSEPSYSERPSKSYAGRKESRARGDFGAGEDDFKLYLGVSWLPTKSEFIASQIKGTFPIGVGFEYLITDNIGLKGYFAWMSFGKTTYTAVVAEGAGTYSYTEWDGSETTLTYTTRTTRDYEIESGLFLGEVSGVFHILPKRKLDIYAQISLGYTGIYTTVKNAAGDILKDGVTDDSFYVAAGPGIAYYFSDWYISFDINFVLGTGLTAGAAADKLKFDRENYTMNLTAGFIF